MDFRQFLEVKYLEWQRESGGRKTVLEFANYLGVKQQTVSNWWNGERLPQGENIHKLALKLGMEVYDVLGLDRPDADLHYVQQQWENLTPEERRAIRQQTEGYSTKNETKRSPIKRRTSAP